MTTPPPLSRWIPGHEGHYAITEDGRVWSASRVRPNGGVLRGRWLAVRLSKRGYLEVSLGRRLKHGLIHVLVAAAWIGPRPAGQEVRHLDGNPLNNHRSNLAYGTRREQRLDDVRNGVNGIVAHNRRLGRSRL